MLYISGQHCHKINKVGSIRFNVYLLHSFRVRVCDRQGFLIWHWKCGLLLHQHHFIEPNRF